MSPKTLSRRRLLFSVGLAALAVPVLQACGAQPASPTAAPAPKSADTQKPQPTLASQATTKEKPVAQPAATSAPAAAQSKSPAAGSIKMSAALQVGADTTWQVNTARRFAEKHPEVDLEVVQVPGDEMAKKLLTMLATGTLSDVSYSGVKYFAYTAYKGAYLALDDLVKAKDPGLDDFFQASIEGCKFEGKLYAMPMEINTGNTNIVMYNKDMLAEKGVTEPTDDWTFQDFVDAATKLTDKSKNIYGTNLLPTNYYDTATWARSLGGDLLSDDGKQFTLATDEKATEAAKWITELRTVHNAAPMRDESQGLAFPAGQIGLFTTGIYAMVSVPKTIGDKFNWDVVLAPKGPTGLRGYELFTVMFSVAKQTKNPDLSYELLTDLTSKETGMIAFLEDGNPMPRRSIWTSPEAQKLGTIWKRASDWLSDGKNEGPFPMPDNLRFSELQDKYGNLIQGVYYGEVPFEEGIQKIQQECQQIVALPRG